MGVTRIIRDGIEEVRIRVRIREEGREGASIMPCKYTSSSRLWSGRNKVH